MTPKQLEIVEKLRLENSARVDIFERAFNGKSRAAGVKAKCLDCSGLMMMEVRFCPVESCPLWPYRPYQEKEELEGDE